MARQRNDLLKHIEMLWQDAESTGNNGQASTRLDNIATLMQDATTAESGDTANSDNEDGVPRLASLIDQTNDNTNNKSATPPSFEEARARLDSVARLKPPGDDTSEDFSPGNDDSKTGSTDHAFGTTFTDLVHHIVQDYIHTEVKNQIRDAIKSELNSHFTGVSIRDYIRIEVENALRIAIKSELDDHLKWVDKSDK